MRNGDRITLTVHQKFLRQHPDAPIAIDQQIDLQKGDESFYLAVWDIDTGRLGTLQVMLDVHKRSHKQKSAN